MGSYTNETDAEAVCQFDITASTDPDTTEVAAWITQIEADVDARALGSYTLTDQLVDVEPKLGYPFRGTMAWLRSMASGRLEITESGNKIVPPFLPIISVASLSRRTSSLGSTDAWEALTEGSGDGESYLILKRRTKTNQYLGFSLYFHQNAPYSGPQRIKMTYNYGWDLSTSIIGEWCTLKVSVKVLDAVMHATSPIGAGDYGVDTASVGIDPSRRRVELIARIKEIEEKYFPGRKLGMALV